MSANGLHINKIGKSKCFFDEDATVRYLYSVCGEDEDAFYTEKSGWTHFCNYKGVPFYRRAVPPDAVKLVRSYGKKHLKQEKSWLNARLSEGLVLIGRIEDEYIFMRTNEYVGYEYITVPIVKNKKSKEKKRPSPLDEADKMTFLTTDSKGSVYYFIKDAKAKNAVLEAKGKRLSDQILSAFGATGSAVGFLSAITATLYGLFGENRLIKPIVIAGGAAALIFAIGFAVCLKRFKRISEERRIRKEELRLKKEAEAQKNTEEAPQKQEPPQSNNNTVVMNTVVMNNYGDGGARDKFKNTGINSYGQLYDTDIIEQNPALDPSLNPALAAAQNSAEIVRTAMQNARYGDAADTLFQGEQTANKQYVSDFAPKTAFNDDEWVSADDGTEPNESNALNDTLTDDDVFPLGKFIFGALLCSAAVLAMIFGLRYGIAYFVYFGKTSVLSLLLSALGIAFSPFAFNYGFTLCKAILNESKTKIKE